MQVEQLIGARMRTRREELGKTQEEICADLMRWLRQPYSRQAKETR